MRRLIPYSLVCRLCSIWSNSQETVILAYHKDWKPCRFYLLSCWDLSLRLLSPIQWRWPELLLLMTFDKIHENVQLTSDNQWKSWVMSSRIFLKNPRTPPFGVPNIFSSKKKTLVLLIPGPCETLVSDRLFTAITGCYLMLLLLLKSNGVRPRTGRGQAATPSL